MMYTFCGTKVFTTPAWDEEAEYFCDYANKERDEILNAGLDTADDIDALVPEDMALFLSTCEAIEDDCSVALNFPITDNRESYNWFGCHIRFLDEITVLYMDEEE